MSCPILFCLVLYSETSGRADSDLLQNIFTLVAQRQAQLVADHAVFCFEGKSKEKLRVTCPILIKGHLQSRIHWTLLYASKGGAMGSYKL